MQTNAVNSVNFTSALQFRKGGADERKARNQQLGEEYRSLVSQMDDNGEDLTLQEKLDIIDKAVEKANSNVHPSTVICSVAGMVGAGLAATKFTKAGRKVAVTVGESISNGVSKLYAKAKKLSIEEAQKIQDNIQNTANRLREGNPDSKLLDNINGFIAKVTGSEEKANLVQEKLAKAGVKDGVSAFDAGVGVLAAATVLDPASDALEQHSDKREILETVNALL